MGNAVNTNGDNLLRLDSLLSMGYGIIPKRAMRDKRLTPEAKAIYAYLCSFAGSGNTAFPSVELMCAEIGVSNDRFYRHRKLLTEYGYLEVEQIRGGRGKTGNNVYTIKHDLPAADAKPQNKAPQNRDPQNKVPQNAVPHDKGSINNSSTNNSFANNSDKEYLGAESGAPITSKRDAPSKPKKPKPIKHKHGEYGHVLLTDDEYERLQERTEGHRDYYIQEVDSYVDRTGRTYQRYFSAVANFFDRDKRDGRVPRKKEKAAGEPIPAAFDW